MHYHDIRLRGHTVDQHFVKDISGKYIHLVTCNHYEFNKEDNPLCELQKDYNKAIVSRDNLTMQFYKAPAYLGGEDI